MMKNVLVAIAIVVVLCVLSAGPARTAPKPSEVQVSWQLDFEFEPPRTIQVRLPGQARPKTFWFMRYIVTNRTGEDQIFVPDFVLYTDTGQVLRAGRNVPTAVFKAIQEAYDEPLMKEMTAMTGKLLQGEDNARQSVAIWPDFDPQAGGFDIFVGGLSGETAEIELPAPITVTEMDYTGTVRTVTKDRLVLTKTLDLKYAIPGEAEARTTTEPKLKARTWIMR